MDDLVLISARDEPQKVAQSGAKPGVYIKTFGCQMNEYDTQKLFKILEDRYRPVNSPAEADLLLINTCSVRDKPEQKLYSLVGKFRALKAANRQALIGVGGCVAQQEGEKILTRSPGVDFVFGTHNLSLVPSLIDERRRTSKPQVAVNYREEWEDLPLGLVDSGRVSVFVSISRGCNKNCTYCIVPKTRGPEVSRSPEEIEREIKIAVHRGAKEVVLLGQTVNSYGSDLSPRFKFVDLLERVAAIAGLERIRFTSPHPQEVRQDFIDLVTSNSKICRHIHMPLQAGSDRILKAMNRNYRKKRYLEIIEALKNRVPDIAITTDIIVGFPGETEADFQETLAVMRQVEFDNSYSFAFSPRPGTGAADLEDQIPDSEKLRRLYELQELQNELTTKKLSYWVGRDVEVLIDGPSAYGDGVQGRTSQNIVVNIGVGFINENNSNPKHLGRGLPNPGGSPKAGSKGDKQVIEPGLLADVRITKQAKFTLRGELIGVDSRVNFTPVDFNQRSF